MKRDSTALPHDIGFLEFSRCVSIAHLRWEGFPYYIELEASGEERESVCRRLDLLSLEVLSGKFRITEEDNHVLLVEGRMIARFNQRCVVTLEPVPGEIDRELSIRFSPQSSKDRDLWLEGDDDELFYEGAGPDLGEALTQELALSLPPWPRLEGARLEQTMWGTKAGDCEPRRLESLIAEKKVAKENRHK